MYDYFIEPDHIAWSEKEKEFITDYLLPSGLDVTNKSLMICQAAMGTLLNKWKI